MPQLRPRSQPATLPVGNLTSTTTETAQTLTIEPASTIKSTGAFTGSDSTPTASETGQTPAIETTSTTQSTSDSTSGDLTSTTTETAQTLTIAPTSTSLPTSDSTSGDLTSTTTETAQTLTIAPTSTSLPTSDSTSGDLTSTTTETAQTLIIAPTSTSLPTSDSTSGDLTSTTTETAQTLTIEPASTIKSTGAFTGSDSTPTASETGQTPAIETTSTTQSTSDSTSGDLTSTTTETAQTLTIAPTSTSLPTSDSTSGDLTSTTTETAQTLIIAPTSTSLPTSDSTSGDLTSTTTETAQTLTIAPTSTSLPTSDSTGGDLTTTTTDAVQALTIAPTTTTQSTSDSTSGDLTSTTTETAQASNTESNNHLTDGFISSTAITTQEPTKIPQPTNIEPKPTSLFKAKRINDRNKLLFEFKSTPATTNLNQPSTMVLPPAIATTSTVGTPTGLGLFSSQKTPEQRSAHLRATTTNSLTCKANTPVQTPVQHEPAASTPTKQATIVSEDNNQGLAVKAPVNIRASKALRTLGLSDSATLTEARSQYLKLIKMLHPDKLVNPTPEEVALANVKAAALNMAWATLKNPQQEENSFDSENQSKKENGDTKDKQGSENAQETTAENTVRASAYSPVPKAQIASVYGSGLSAIQSRINTLSMSHHSNMMRSIHTGQSLSTTLALTDFSTGELLASTEGGYSTPSLVSGNTYSYGQFYKLNMSQDSTGHLSAFDTDGYGLETGVFQQLGSDWSLGFMFGFHRMDSDFQGFGSQLKANSFRAGPFASLNRGPWHFDSTLTYGWSDLDSKRHDMTTAQLSTANFAVKDWSLHSSLYYDIPMDHMVSGLTLTPGVEVLYSASQQDSIREKGKGDNLVRVKSLHRNDLVTRAGLQSTYRITDEHPYEIKAGVGYQNNHLDNPDMEAGTDLAGTQQLKAGHYDKNSVYYNIGLTTSPYNNQRVSFDYSGFRGKNSEGNSFSIDYNIRF